MTLLAAIDRGRADVEPDRAQQLADATRRASQLSQSTHVPDVIVAAGDPHLPEPDALRLTTHPAVKVVRALATNTSYPSVWDVLSRHADGQVRRRVAAATQDPALLVRLADDSDSGVRAAVANNSDSPGHVYDRLVCDQDPKVALAAAARAITMPPAAVVALLADGRHRTLAGNQRRLAAVLRQPIPDRVIGEAEEALRLFVDKVHQPDVDTQSGISPVVAFVNNPHLSDTVKERMCDTVLAAGVMRLNRSLARQPGTPDETIRCLAGDPNPDVSATARRTAADRGIDDADLIAALVGHYATINPEVQALLARATDEVAGYGTANAAYDSAIYPDVATLVAGYNAGTKGEHPWGGPPYSRVHYKTLRRMREWLDQNT